MQTRLLIVEDDPQLAQMLAWHFEDRGYQARAAHSCTEALRELERGDMDLILLDQQLPDGTGTELLQQILAATPDQAVIMITGQHDLELAIGAIQNGAAEFIHKPIQIDELEQVVERVLGNRLQARQARTRPREDPGLPSRNLIGRSQAMLNVSKEIALSAESAANVLISGESGTGKEIVARLIHAHSKRAGPFVAVNCAAIVDSLLESELFGHEKGAFTGASDRRAGKFEQAQHGTLFLDEVGELALPLQAKLLRALQERGFERVGGSELIRSDARIVAATNRDLRQRVTGGQFREDLFYRLQVISIHIPPLRERKEDIPLLAHALMQKIGQVIGKPNLRISDDAIRLLLARDWPGNVRELENSLTQAMLHARTDLITLELFDTPAAPPSKEQDTAPPPPGEIAHGEPVRTLEEVEAEYIQRVLDHTQGHKSRSCTILGISRPALDRKIRKFGLRVPDKQDPAG